MLKSFRSDDSALSILLKGGGQHGARESEDRPSLTFHMACLQFKRKNRC